MPGPRNFDLSARQRTYQEWKDRGPKKKRGSENKFPVHKIHGGAEKMKYVKKTKHYEKMKHDETRHDLCQCR